MKIRWKDQHCGVHQASPDQLFEEMPDLKEMIVQTFPGRINNFIWDVKVHMLMPGQFPCIPNWHYNNIPRVNNVQDFEQIKSDSPMYLWLSGGPLTEFRDKTKIIKPETWIRFTQCDEHRGVQAKNFCWRGFIRATHKDIMPSNKTGHNSLRRHSQVYLDASNFSW